MVLNGHEIFALSPLVLLLVTIYLRLSSFIFELVAVTLILLFVCFSAEDAVEKQHTSSDSSGPTSVMCVEGNGHPVKKHEVVILLQLYSATSVTKPVFENRSSSSTSTVQLNFTEAKRKNSMPLATSTFVRV